MVFSSLIRHIKKGRTTDSKKTKKKRKGPYFMREVYHSDPYLDYSNSESRGLECGRRDAKKRYLQASAAIRKDDINELRHILAIISTRAWVELAMNSKKETLFMHAIKSNAEECANFLYEDGYDLWIGYKGFESILKRVIKRKMNDESVRLFKPALYHVLKKVLAIRRREKRELRERPSFTARQARRAKSATLNTLARNASAVRRIAGSKMLLGRAPIPSTIKKTRDFDDDDDDDESTAYTMTPRTSLNGDIWSSEHLPIAVDDDGANKDKRKSRKRICSKRSISSKTVKRAKRPNSSHKSVHHQHNKSITDRNNNRPQSMKVRPMSYKRATSPSTKSKSGHAIRPKSAPQIRKWFSSSRKNNISQRNINHESIWADSRASHYNKQEQKRHNKEDPPTPMVNLLFCSQLGQEQHHSNNNDDTEDTYCTDTSYLFCDRKALGKKKDYCTADYNQKNNGEYSDDDSDNSESGSDDESSGDDESASDYDDSDLATYEYE